MKYSSGLIGLDDCLDKNNVFYKQMEISANEKAKEILKFMFPHSMAESMNLWFGKSPKTDDYIRETFVKAVCEAMDGKYDHWINNPIECLALIILLDQFPRNIYRHQVYQYLTYYLIYTIIFIGIDYFLFKYVVLLNPTCITI